MSGSWARELEIGASFLCAEISFVRAIPTVVLAVTFPSGRHASTVITAELAGGTRHVLATRLVAKVAAIVFGIALERLWNATTTRTLEFLWRTCGFCTILFFVTVVQTIVLPIAYPGFGDAPLVGTGEVPAVWACLHWGFCAWVSHTGASIFSETFAIGTATLGYQSK